MIITIHHLVSYSVLLSLLQFILLKVLWMINKTILLVYFFEQFLFLGVNICSLWWHAVVWNSWLYPIHRYFLIVFRGASHILVFDELILAPLFWKSIHTKWAILPCITIIWTLKILTVFTSLFMLLSILFKNIIRWILLELYH